MKNDLKMKKLESRLSDKERVIIVKVIYLKLSHFILGNYPLIPGLQQVIMKSNIILHSQD